MTAGGPSSRTYRRSGAHGMHAAMRVRCLGCARASLARLGVQVALSVPRPDNMTQLYFGPDPDGFWWELLAESERAPEGLLSDPLGTWPLLPRRRKLAGLPPSSGPSSSRGTGGAVASGNPLVSAAVESVLKAGGSAADGAVAAAAVLGVVEPCAAAHTHVPCTAAGARHAALPDSPRLVPPPLPPTHAQLQRRPRWRRLRPRRRPDGRRVPRRGRPGPRGERPRAGLRANSRSSPRAAARAGALPRADDRPTQRADRARRCGGLVRAAPAARQAPLAHCAAASNRSGKARVHAVAAHGRCVGRGRPRSDRRIAHSVQLNSAQCRISHDFGTWPIAGGSLRLPFRLRATHGRR